MALCKVMIIGNLGSDPEMRYTPTNRAVTQFNVAVNQSTKNQQTGEWVEETDWFRVSVWGDRAERMAESLRKGNKVFVEGRFKTRTFEGRDGQTRTALEITADSIVNLERRPRDDEGSFGGPSVVVRPARVVRRRGRRLLRRKPRRRRRRPGRTSGRRQRPSHSVRPTTATLTTFPSDDRLTRRT